MIVENILMMGTAIQYTKLRIANWNSRGFSAAVPYLRHILEINDIVSVSEHWLHRNQLYKLKEVDNDFNCLGRASKAATEAFYGVRRGSGGVAIYWRKNISGVSPLLNVNHDRVCGIRLQTTNNCIMYVLSVYLPAAGSPEDLSSVLDELSGIIESLDEGSTCIVTGDFNGDIGTQGGPRSSRQASRAGLSVLKFMNKYDYVAANLADIAHGAVDTFTCHNGSSTIDYAMVPRTYMGNIIQCFTEGEHVLNTSDHSPVMFDIDVNGFFGQVDYQQNSKSIRWDKLDPAGVQERYTTPLAILIAESQAINEDDPPPGDVIDALFDDLISKIHDAAEGVPRSKFKSHLKPFWSDDLSAMKRDKMHWFKLWKNQGRTLDDDDPVRVRMKHSKKLFHRTLRLLSRKYDNTHSHLSGPIGVRIWSRGSPSPILMKLIFSETNMS